MFAWIAVMTATSVWLSFSGAGSAVLQVPLIGDLQRVVPSIRKLSAISPSPIHTAALFSLMWAAAPVLVAAMVQQRDLLFPRGGSQSTLPLDYRRLRDLPEVHGAPRYEVLKIVVATALLSALGFYMAFFLPLFDTGDPRMQQHWLDLVLPLARSRLGSGVFGGLVIFFVAYAAVACFTFTSRMLTGRSKWTTR